MSELSPGLRGVSKKKPIRRRVWFVANRNMMLTKDGKLITLRGPYKHAETAGAVRTEMESAYPNAEWNLWVVWEWRIES